MSASVLTRPVFSAHAPHPPSSASINLVFSLNTLDQDSVQTYLTQCIKFMIFESQLPHKTVN